MLLVLLTWALHGAEWSDSRFSRFTPEDISLPSIY